MRILILRLDSLQSGDILQLDGYAADYHGYILQLDGYVAGYILHFDCPAAGDILQLNGPTAVLIVLQPAYILQLDVPAARLHPVIR